MLELFILSLVLSQQLLISGFEGKPGDEYEPFPFTLIKTQSAHLENDKKLVEKGNQMIKKDNVNLNKINEDCLFILKSFGQTFVSPYPRCARQPEPVILKSFKEGLEGTEYDGGDPQLTCGPDGVIGQEYKFGYQLCFKLGVMGKLGNQFQKLFKKTEGFPLDDVQSYPMYQFCYDIQSKITIYTKHRLSSPRLLWYPEMQKEREKVYEMSTKSYNLPGLDFEQMRNAYLTVENSPNQENAELKEESSKDEIQNRYKIQKLVPPNDFSFALLRKPTFHWANTELMHENLIKYWNRVNEFIREDAIQTNRSFAVYTGAFVISQNADDIVTMDGIQIPQIWVKIIDNSYSTRVKHPHYYLKKYIRSVKREGVAIIANNYMSENVMRSLIDASYCEKNLCKNFAKEELPDFYKFIWCCSVKAELLELFGVKLKFYDIYRIDGLIQLYTD